LPLPSLSFLRGVSSAHRSQVSRFISRRANEVFSRFLSNPTCFRSMIDHTNSCVSGSAILEIALQSSPVQPWLATDLDVYVPLTAIHTVMTYLADNEGFLAVFPPQLPPDIAEYGAGIAGVVHMVRPHGVKIDLIVSTRMSSLYPLAYFWGTCVMNWFKNGQLGFAYPKLTLQGLGLINPDKIRHPKVRACIDKYTARGFRLGRFEEGNPFHTDRSLNVGYCPRRFRYFGDRTCLLFNVPDGEAHRLVEDGLPMMPELKTFWTFGHSDCGNGCGGA
ncbi:hypothetical protein DENSPDRAFT_748253, partial [Dentipellis sp. KUC8613]